MNEAIILCPGCQTEIRPTESLAAPLLAASRQQFEQRLLHKDQEIAAREQELRVKDKQIGEEKLMSPQVCESNLVPFNGELYLIRQFYPKPEADWLLARLKDSLLWQEESIFIFGKWCKVPRLMCWYGDPGAAYRYSGVDHPPNPWTGDLLAVRDKIECHCQRSFNSVLANMYRDGRDSMGCHADDEKELGQNPVIASLSLGEERLFKLYHKKRKHRLEIDLGHGDLIVMAGVLQHHWVHSLPKTALAKGLRINLTFRTIVPVT